LQPENELMCVDMNMIKKVLVLVFVSALLFPCFGSEVMIKRKKNKWISSVEQISPFNYTHPHETTV